MERGRKMSSSLLIYFSNRNNWEMFKKPVESEARKVELKEQSPRKDCTVEAERVALPV